MSMRDCFAGLFPVSTAKGVADVSGVAKSETANKSGASPASQQRNTSNAVGGGGVLIAKIATPDDLPPNGAGVFEKNQQIQSVHDQKTPATLKTLPTQELDADFLDAFHERVAIIEANGVPHEWASGFATLCTMPRPSAFAPDRWQQLVDDGGAFLDRWGRQAAALGWRAADVFGCRRHNPDQSYGAGLVLLLQGRKVARIGVDRAWILYEGNVHHAFRRENVLPTNLPVWTLCTEQTE